jgi:hypothetical protein
MSKSRKSPHSGCSAVGVCSHESRLRPRRWGTSRRHFERRSRFRIRLDRAVVTQSGVCLLDPRGGRRRQAVQRVEAEVVDNRLDDEEASDSALDGLSLSPGKAKVQCTGCAFGEEETIELDELKQCTSRRRRRAWIARHCRSGRRLAQNACLGTNSAIS